MLIDLFTPCFDYVQKGGEIDIDLNWSNMHYILVWIILWKFLIWYMLKYMVVKWVTEIINLMYISPMLSCFGHHKKMGRLLLLSVCVIFFWF